jgi:MoaA/NifB/PqqE/SkfB family radical SAM enzyme
MKYTADTRLEEYITQKKPTLAPESLALVLTNACNLTCITCWSYSPLLAVKPNKAWKTRQLPFDLVGNLLEEIALIGTQRLILTGGGDPLVYPQFYEVVELAKKLSLKVTLISNLTLIRDFERFKALKIDTIQANFSAADASSYVAFHPNRKPADFDKMMLQLEILSKTTPDLKLVCVICQTNVHLIDKTLHLAAKLSAGIQFKLMSIAEGTANVAISEAERQILLSQESSINALAESLQVKTNLPVFFKTLKGEHVHSFPIEEIGCFAGHWYARVQADGEVRFCCNPHESLTISNLHLENFTTIWQSEKYQAVRNKLRNQDFVSGCERCGKFDLNFKIHQKLSAI